MPTIASTQAEDLTSEPSSASERDPSGDEEGVSDAQQASLLLEQADQRMFAHRDRIRASHERVDAPEVLTETLAGRRAELAGRFTAGNRSNAVIDEAKGLIAEHFDIGISEASTMLSAFAAAQSQSLQIASAALMAREIDAARLAPHVRPSARPHEGTDQHAPSARS